MNALEFSEEITALFIKAINGEVQIKPTGVIWNEAFSCNCEFDIDGYKVTFFNDAEELDYTDNVTAPDGRTADFDYWWDNNCDPLDALTEPQLDALEKLLEDAKP